MDFGLSETQQTLARICDEILPSRDDQAVGSAESLADSPLWRTACHTGLLTVLLAEESGGSGLGAADACIVAAQCGKASLTLPVANAMVTSAVAAALGTSDAAAGASTAPSVESLAAFTPVGYGSADPGAGRPELDPLTGRFNGDAVLAPTGARRLLVWVTVDETDAAVLLDVASGGVPAREVSTTGGRFSTYAITEADPRHAEVVVGEHVRYLKRHSWQLTLLLGCAELGGLADGALAMTADYAARRLQFGRPIGSFQAVSTRLADCYIDVQAMQWTLWRAAERFDERRPVDKLLAVARVLACQGSDRVLAAAQHVHGGLGVDVSYPLHRYFLRTRHLLLAAGGAERHLADLGATLADPTADPVADSVTA